MATIKKSEDDKARASQELANYEAKIRRVRKKRQKIAQDQLRLDKLESDILYLAKQLGVKLK